MWSLTDDEVASLGEGRAVVRDDLVPREQTARWRRAVDAVDAAGGLTPAAMGRARVHRPELRGDHTAFVSELPADPALADAWGFFDRVREEVSRACWLGLQRFTLQVARFPPGTRYVRHRDVLRSDPSRRVTAIVYLEPDWRPEHGGELRVWEPEPRDLRPLEGRMVLFLSDRLLHEVQPATRNRTALTAWYRGAVPVPLVWDPEVVYS